MGRLIGCFGAALLLVWTSQAAAQTYAVVEQDTHSITVIAVETVSSPEPTTRRFKMVSISAWPELWQDSYKQIGEYMVELDCWNHTIEFGGGSSIDRDIEGKEIGQTVGNAVTWPISDGYEAYEHFLCDNRTTVSVPPFRSLEEVKKYYFNWLNRNVKRVTAE
jgi:hypothetical protein